MTPLDGSRPMQKQEIWDVRYERRAVLALCLGFGLVGLDRLMIMPMFPAMMKDLALSYQDIGLITGALAFTWGISAFFAGRAADMFGTRKVLIGAMISFSLLIGLNGLATGLVSLVILRALMGLAEGAYVTPSIAATMDAAHPSRRGLVIGIQQMANPLFGLTLAPLFVTQLLHVLDWRWIFPIVALPGLVMAYVLHRTIRPGLPAGEVPKQRPGVQETLSFSNVLICMALMPCWLTALIVISALFPSYLIDVLHLDLSQTGLILSAMGLGAVAGTIVISSFSDRIGRRTAVLLSALGTGLSLFWLSHINASPTLLFAVLFLEMFFNFALITLTSATIAMEAVPARLRGTATGIVIASGEIIGGGCAPVIAGFSADRFGLESIFIVATVAAAIGFCLAMRLRRPADQDVVVHGSVDERIISTGV